AWFGALYAVACTKPSPLPATPAAAAAEQTTPEPAPARPVDRTRAPAPPPPAEAPRPEQFVELNVPELEPSVVSFPPTAAFPQPVFISTHGAGDSALQMCEYWRALLGDRGIVLCPAGPRMRAHE